MKNPKVIDWRMISAMASIRRGVSLVVALFCMACGMEAGALRQLPGFRANTFGPNDDASYPCESFLDTAPTNCTPEAVNLGFSLTFYGKTFSSLFINNNGNVSFDAAVPDFTPYLMQDATNQIIAPFFADVDTRVGNVVSFGADVVDGHPAFGVNWAGVGYYRENTDKLNSFQLVLISRADRNPGDFDMEFNYDQIQWETGDVGGGVGGVGGESAVAGFSDGSGNPGASYQMDGSRIAGTFLDASPAGLVHGSLNSDVPGRYVTPIVNLTELALNVPRFNQTDPTWGDDTYAGSSYGIRAKGSALTSLAMVLSYAGVKTDPGALNTLLEAGQDYVGTGVNWDPAVRDASHGSLHFHAHRGSDLAYLSAALGANHPVIVGVELDSEGNPSHYIVVTGVSGGQYLINDPADDTRTTLDAYSNTFEIRGYVSGGASGGLDIAGDDAIDVMLIDASGRVTGSSRAGGVRAEMPQSVHFADRLENGPGGGAGDETTHEVVVDQAAAGPYRLFLIGKAASAYTVTIRAFGPDGSGGSPLVISGTAAKGAVQEVDIAFANGAIVQTSPPTALPVAPFYSFSGGNDGADPEAALAQGVDGNFYGTAAHGGAYDDNGTAFQITPDGVFTSLHSFGAAKDIYNNPTDGGVPLGGLTQAADGAWYGTASVGGPVEDTFGGGFGVLYKLDGNGAYSVVWGFGGVLDQDGNPLDGAAPNAAVVIGPDGTIYGTTQAGGNTPDPNSGQYGTVFEIQTNGDFSSLYSFGTVQDGDGNPVDGSGPVSSVTVGTDGNLYGVTPAGGTHTNYNSGAGGGTIFKITAAGDFSSLYSFSGGADGAAPLGALLQGADGGFYGTTSAGGTNGVGAVFRFTEADGLRTLHTFSGRADGAVPMAGLVAGPGGLLYGTASEGGLFGGGTVYSISTTGVFTTLYSFFGEGDGAHPHAPLLHATDGAFYGSTSVGGANNLGALYRMTLPAPHPKFTSIAMTGAGVTLTWAATTGQTFQLQYAADPTSAAWTNIGAVLTATGSTVTATDPGALNARRFYRFLQLP
jgi:uncharacterized repeat protein (TIGR03803 family)